jgi:cytochrome c-type biogenesis protein
VSLAVLLGALVAGVLTTLAPCILPLLPVIVGGSVAPPPSDAAPRGAGAGTGAGGVAVATRVRAPSRRALIIVGSLGLSVIVFTLLLKASTSLLGVPPQVWQYVSGGILVALGLAGVFPAQWDRVSAALRLQGRSTARLARADARDGTLGAVLTGAALGPVFSSCSPLYAYVVVTVLPASFADGLVLLIAYVVGLCATLLAIALLGQRFVRRMGWAADPHGWFRRALGIVFLVVGVGVMLGWDRALQTWVLENSPIQPWNLDSGFIPEGS